MAARQTPSQPMRSPQAEMDLMRDQMIAMGKRLGELEELFNKGLVNFVRNATDLRSDIEALRNEMRALRIQLRDQLRGGAR